MSLSASLVSVGLTFQCPQCNFAVIKNGSWFQVVSHYKCEGCRREIRITYPDKIGIFQKHARSDPISPEPGEKLRIKHLRGDHSHIRHASLLGFTNES